MDITELLAFVVKQNASDLHLSAGVPPLIRVDGDLKRLDLPAMDNKTVLSLLYEIMNDKQRAHFEKSFEVDFSFEINDLARFRANVFTQGRGVAGVFRNIPSIITSLDEFNFPPIFKDLLRLSRGLILVTGPTGSGKSTTLAAMIDYINKNEYGHILTIEDPIEYIHQSDKCLINQREVYRDTLGFNEALRSALREDPDIILVGEMRDVETIRLALTAAETGHLVLASLHTTSAAKTINRIIDVFPGEEKAMVLSMLSASLEAVISQSLIKRVGGGRVAALEIMVCNPAVRNLIREDKIAQIYSVIQTGTASGMRTLDQHLKDLVASNTITRATAADIAVNKEQFTQ
jgi:twitching motility protein PilT